jgi:DNA-binding transcriptional ArsR family regulator
MAFTTVQLRYACADEHTRVQILRAVAAENHGDLVNVSIIDDAVITLKAGQLTISYRIDVDASFGT